MVVDVVMTNSGWFQTKFSSIFYNVVILEVKAQPRNSLKIQWYANQCEETAADFHLAYGGLWLFVLRLTAKSQDYAKSHFFR